MLESALGDEKDEKLEFKVDQNQMRLVEAAIGAIAGIGVSDNCSFLISLLILNYYTSLLRGLVLIYSKKEVEVRVWVGANIGNEQIRLIILSIFTKVYNY